MFSVIRSLLGGSKHRLRDLRRTSNRCEPERFHWNVAQLETRCMLAIDTDVGDSPQSVTTGQFNDDNNDGVIDQQDFLDVATANSGSNDVSVLLGRGDGSFVDETRVGDIAEPFSVTVGDFNGAGVNLFDFHFTTPNTFGANLSPPR